MRTSPLSTSWQRLALLLFIPALMGFRGCGTDVDIGGSRPDAGSAYDPCEGLSCGASCSQCPPDDTDCVEPAVLNYCQTDGSCAPTTPECSAPYDPCDGLSCGASCSQCPPDDPECVEPAVLNYCQADGSCAPTTPECSAPYDPCDGLSCGASCSQCPPDDPECVEPAVLNYCQADGSCAPTRPECLSCDRSAIACRVVDPVCGDGEVPSVIGTCWGPCVPAAWCPPSYDPCDGLSCGSSCSQCPPDDPECVEPAVLNYCQADGSCAPTRPECLSCDRSAIACRVVDPVCGDGEVPSVIGTCWGPCVPAAWCPPSYDPCDGLRCGASCSLCPPDDRDCVEPAVLNYCQPDGSCRPTTPVCEAYDPCAGLLCGASCSHCPPGDTDCVEPAVVNYCHSDGTCSPITPTCLGSES